MDIQYHDDLLKSARRRPLTAEWANMTHTEAHIMQWITETVGGMVAMFALAQVPV
jgi:hypothetical protein